MTFTEETWDYFSSIPHRVRAGMAQSNSIAPFEYDEESFFSAYKALYDIWKRKQSQRQISETLKVGRKTVKKWESDFEIYGAIGLLPKLSYSEIDSQLESLVILIKRARSHENASLALCLAEALKISGPSLERIRHIQRCYGYGQRMDKKDQQYYQELQHILFSVQKQKSKTNAVHNKRDRSNTFFDYNNDRLQHRIELFRELNSLQKKRQIRLVLKKYGIAPNRFYELKNRYLRFGIWGLVDLVQKKQVGEKISPELELTIIEERLMDPTLSTTKMMRKFDLKCSRSRVQNIYSKWHLSSFKQPVPLRGVTPGRLPDKVIINSEPVRQSAKMQFPNLIENSLLKVNTSFRRLVNPLHYRSVMITNPGALLIAPFLDQLGIVEAIHTYGPKVCRTSDITNLIIINVLRIIAGFPTINDYTANSDRSVAIAAGLSLNPAKSRFYDSLNEFRFEHLQNLRNDTGCRARELGIIDGKKVAIDYHCDKCDSRFPHDKSLSKAPDKNGDMVYAHRPQILWDSLNNTIINIAYCEGSSRGPSALYRFCEDNLFKIITRDVLHEIYADSEYTGEKQVLYLSIRSYSDVIMCLKQNPRIKRWKEETLKNAKWEYYGKNYRITSQDFKLSESEKPFRFVVKQNMNTNETRCFGSTHMDYTPKRILDSYHIRWPVETGIKDLIENYYLNKPTGTSPEKIEAHYYSVMIARLCVDYFQSVLCVPEWHTPESWDCVLSTIRTSIFSNQNCELRLNDSGDFLITYLDGDKNGIKKRLAKVMAERKKNALNKVSWWGGRGVLVDVKNQFDF